MICPTCRPGSGSDAVSGRNDRQFRLKTKPLLPVKLWGFGKTKVGHVPELKRSTPSRVGLPRAFHFFHLAHCPKKGLQNVP